MEYINKSLRDPTVKPTHQPTTRATTTKENALVLRVVDIGSKNTNELDQSRM